ncbi:MAG: hypothetical protein J6Z49_10715 [Kiritimatiellae bacterium]|nr:hypothetical protein [Kiritimatiellia bacterium]
MKRSITTTMALVTVTAFYAIAQENPAAEPAPAVHPPVAPALEGGGVPPSTEAAAEAKTASALPDGKISISFDKTPLESVILAFREASGANFVTRSTVTNLQDLVTFKLEDIPWKDGLATILADHNLMLTYKDNIYFIEPVPVVVDPRETQTFELQYAKADDIKKLFDSTLGTDGKVSSFASANAVVVTATKQKLDECERILKTIDKAPPQIFIEARFAELTASAARQLGLKWDTLKGWNAGAGPTSLGYSNDRTLNSSKGSQFYEVTSTTADGIQNTTRNLLPNLTKTTEYLRTRTFSTSLSADAFRLTLSAFEQMDGVQVFSNPKIIVSNEKEALVDMTTKYPNVEVTSTRSGDNQNQLDITAKLTTIPGEKNKDADPRMADPFVGSAFFSYGISLSVRPRVSPNGLITVDIVPSISEVNGFYDVGATGNSDASPYSRYPIINMKRLITTFTMQSGTTAVIGGLSKTEENITDSGIPGLRHIPWIGPHLFGWKSREKVQKEIIIFVTVGIADPQNIPSDVGMPKNAILGREIIRGNLKEPGDRTVSEVLDLRDKPLNDRKELAAPVESDEPAPMPAPEPVQTPVETVPAPEPAPVVAQPMPETAPVAAPAPATPAVPAVKPLLVD